MTALERLERVVGRWFGVSRVRVHPLFVALLVAAYFVGMLKQALLLFMFVFLHECGHAVVAKRLGYEIEEVSLLPFGGVAQLSYVRLGFSPKSEAMVAIAGPAVNLLCALLALVLYTAGVIDGRIYGEIIGLNGWIAVFNLLPGLPLDGGRIYRAVRSREKGYEPATEEAYRMSIALSAVLMFAGVAALFAGRPHIGMVVLGLFLFVTAWRGRRDLRLETMRFLDAKRRDVGSTMLRTRALAVSAAIPIRDVVVRFSPDRYHIVYILHEDGTVASLVEEPELLDAVFEGRWLEPIASLRL
ncbi:peptidase M50 [Alicyclobacillus hesperidum URH17-3-68]|uniref:Peptidase M50 n=1 Tax=Alicyclobacillus hesperidum TaxID=89784 RepID=A0A1H2T7F0_9BACL|nr:M50 family metallopeptidase [Alicyclobacillus hesperidum]EJY55954.1 peptidase M50 [Alicyclobacillus hesperidum URH17-3-68]GLV13791.1 peptidase M50 [Alicyclobacillus hesperidum]SDW39886.1 stage IV sporulation protein FB [Alicyclobacillus hesperidum]